MSCRRLLNLGNEGITVEFCFYLPANPGPSSVKRSLGPIMCLSPKWLPCKGECDLTATAPVTPFDSVSLPSCAIDWKFTPLSVEKNITSVC
jgi:hypothetical protein